MTACGYRMLEVGFQFTDQPTKWKLYEHKSIVVLARQVTWLFGLWQVLCLLHHSPYAEEPDHPPRYSPEICSVVYPKAKRVL